MTCQRGGAKRYSAGDPDAEFDLQLSLPTTEYVGGQNVDDDRHDRDSGERLYVHFSSNTQWLRCVSARISR